MIIFVSHVFKGFKSDYRSTLVAQWVKDLALSLLHLWCGFNPWPGNCHIPWGQPENLVTTVTKVFDSTGSMASMRHQLQCWKVIWHCTVSGYLVVKTNARICAVNSWEMKWDHGGDEHSSVPGAEWTQWWVIVSVDAFGVNASRVCPEAERCHSYN